MHKILRDNTRKWACCHFLCLAALCLMLSKDRKNNMEFKDGFQASRENLKALAQVLKT